MTKVRDVTQCGSRCQSDKDETIKQLARPWVFIVLVAFTATIFSQTQNSIVNSQNRFLTLIHDDQGDEDGPHKSLLPLDSTDMTGFFFAIIGLMIAAGGGIGGGGILVPIYILIMRFPPKQAIPLSNITVFGGAIANTYLNTKKRHPFADRPLVDWDLIMIMEPLTIGGALIGAFLNKTLNEVVLTCMLVLLLGVTSYTTLKKAVKMYRRETKLAQKENQYDLSSELLKLHLEEEETGDEEATSDLMNDVEGREDHGLDRYEEVAIANELQQILDEERVTPMGNIITLCIMFFVILFINIMKGGGAFPSPLGIECGSPLFWVSNAAMLMWVFVISSIARSYLVDRFEVKEKVNFLYVEGDIRWDSRATVIYPLVCCLAGFFAGMFGVGGGIVKGPLMLAMGVHPAVASASSACMILFTSFTATTSFVVFGLLTYDYGAVCLSVGFVATLVGQIILNALMKKYQRNSYIAFSIGIVVLLSAFLMTAQSLIAIAEGDHQSGGEDICDT